MKVGTNVQRNGRGEELCPEMVAEADAILGSARALCVDLSAALELEIERLQFDTKPEGRYRSAQERKDRLAKVDGLVRQNQKALQTVLNVRTKLLRAMGGRVPNKGLMDLDQARAEITRKLARLAA